MTHPTAPTLRAPLFHAHEFQRLIDKATRSFARKWPDRWIQHDEADNEYGGDITSEAWLCLSEIIAGLAAVPPVSLDTCYQCLRERGIEKPEGYLVQSIKNALLAYIQDDAQYESAGNPHEVFDDATDAGPNTDAGPDDPPHDAPIDAALAKVRSRCRDETDLNIVALRLDGRGIRETAATLGIAPNTVRRRLADLKCRVKPDTSPRRKMMEHHDSI